jgi:hypothetical protein
MDDNGNGTAMAGIMVARMGNKEGIAGVSTGKLVAVKVVNAQGWAVSYNVAAGINYCASLSTVKILIIGVNSNFASAAMHAALVNAINTKGKLVVAAAGDTNSTTFVYPAAWASDSAFQFKLLAIAAIDDGSTATKGCRYPLSNYGWWITAVAPGKNVYTTTPYDKPFYLNYGYGTPARYAYMSGTAMAAAFVAAGAARRWGYKPTETNLQVGNDFFSTTFPPINDNDICWPSVMGATTVLNVAYQLDRGAAYANINNSTTGLPLPGAQFQLYQGTKLVGSGSEPGYNLPYVEAINLPVGPGYTAKVNLSGVTNGPQPAFQQSKPSGFAAGAPVTISGGSWTDFGYTAIPPKSGNFDVVAGWGQDTQAVSGLQLDMDVWLPYPGAPFIVTSSASEGDAFGYLENNPSGSLLYFPFALSNRAFDGLEMLSTTISKRLAHAPLSANSNLPYYPGSYYIGINDYGGTFSSGSHAGDHLLKWAWPFAYLWKDGAIKDFIESDGGASCTFCNSQYWFPFTITSGTSGSVPTILNINTYTNSTSYPYTLGSSDLSIQPGPQK